MKNATMVRALYSVIVVVTDTSGVHNFMQTERDIQAGEQIVCQDDKEGLAVGSGGTLSSNDSNWGSHGSDGELTVVLDVNN